MSTIKSLKHYQWPDNVTAAALVCYETVYLALRDWDGVWYYCHDFEHSGEYPLNEPEFIIWEREDIDKTIYGLNEHGLEQFFKDIETAGATAVGFSTSSGLGRTPFFVLCDKKEKWWWAVDWDRQEVRMDESCDVESDIISKWQAVKSWQCGICGVANIDGPTDYSMIRAFLKEAEQSGITGIGYSLLEGSGTIPNIAYRDNEGEWFWSEEFVEDHNEHNRITRPEIVIWETEL